MKETTCTSCNRASPLVRGSTLCFNCYINGKETGKVKKPKKHEEDDMQTEFFRIAATTFPKLDKLLFAIPNGGKREAKEAARLKKQGVKSGVADIFLSVPNRKYPGLYIELKTITGAQSGEQKIFQQQATKAGYAYIVCRSAEEAIETIKFYLKNLWNQSS